MNREQRENIQPSLSFEEELEVYRFTGVRRHVLGIGLWEGCPSNFTAAQIHMAHMDLSILDLSPLLSSISSCLNKPCMSLELTRVDFQLQLSQVLEACVRYIH